MSYILDALVKADLERHRQQVPGLNTVQVVLPPRESMQRRWLAGAAGALVAAGFVFLAWGRPGPLPPAVPSTAPEQGPQAPMPPTALPLRTDSRVPAVPPIAAQPSQTDAQGRDGHREASAASRIETASEERKIRPSSRLYDIAELPPALQKEARNLTVAGYAQISDAGESMAIIDNRAWREGDEVAKGLKVERISSEGVTFNLKGYRFRKGGP